MFLDEGDRRLDGFVVALHRRRLSVPGHTVVRDRHMNDVGVVGRIARDHERLGEMETHDAGLDLHRASVHWRLPRARSSGDRARASGARGRRFESCRAHFGRLLRALDR